MLIAKAAHRPHIRVMYSTCMFCHHPLGTNDVFETFPVGRRLAFDAAKGRLWVVCNACERWNLTPLEERWDAVEAAERLYRDTKLRVATENIGLARLADGTGLVRIGKPQRPELAAWRYGDQFGQRRRRRLLQTGVGLVAAGAVVSAVSAGVQMLFGEPILGMSLIYGVGGGAWASFYQMGRDVAKGKPNTIVAAIRAAGVPSYQLTRAALWHVQLVWEKDRRDWALAIPHEKGTTIMARGDEAHRVAAQLLPVVNRYGGTTRLAANAVALLEHHGDAETLFRAVASECDSTESGYRDVLNGHIEFVSGGIGIGKNPRGLLTKLTATQRLALEMAAHEDSERRALEGELAELERAWREAEKIAAIADDLFLPAGVARFFEKHRPR